MSRRRPSALVLAAALAACAGGPAPLPPAGTAPAPAAAAPAGYGIAAVQYRIEGDRNLAQILIKVSEHVDAARKLDAALLVFPELMAFDAWPVAAGPTVDDSAAARRIAREVTPVLLTAVRDLARDARMAVLVGAPRLTEGGGLRNAAFLLRADGTQVVQDKLFLTAWERAAGFEPGDALQVIEAPWGRTVVTICYDVEFPAVSQALAEHDIEVFLVPSMAESAYATDRVGWTARARAVEHHACVVVAATVGTAGPDWQHHGRSAVFLPRDAAFPVELPMAPVGRAGMAFERLDVDALRRSRHGAGMFPVRDQQALDAPAIRVTTGAATATPGRR